MYMDEKNVLENVLVTWTKAQSCTCNLHKTTLMDKYYDISVCHRLEIMSYTGKVFSSQQRVLTLTIDHSRQELLSVEGIR